MSFDPNGVAIQDWADKNAQVFKGFTGFGENVMAMTGFMIDQELSNSSLMNPLTAYGDEGPRELRNRGIRTLVEDGTITEDILEKFKYSIPRTGGYRIDYEALANYANENLQDDTGHIATEKDLRETMLRDIQTGHRFSMDIMDRADWTGIAGQLFAGFTTSALDPIVAASMGISLPLVGAARTTKSMYVLANALRVGFFEMGVQLSIEPMIVAWKEEIGVEYTLDDVIFNAAAAFGFGATVAGAASFLGYNFTGSNILTKERGKIKQIFEDAGIPEEHAEVLANSLHEMANAPDPDMPVEEFISKAERQQEYMGKNGQEDDVESPLDVDEASPEVETSGERHQREVEDASTRLRAEELDDIGRYDDDDLSVDEGVMDEAVIRVSKRIIRDKDPDDITKMTVNTIMTDYRLSEGLAIRVHDELNLTAPDEIDTIKKDEAAKRETTEWFGNRAYRDFSSIDVKDTSPELINEAYSLKDLKAATLIHERMLEKRAETEGQVVDHRTDEEKKVDLAAETIVLNLKEKVKEHILNIPVGKREATNKWIAKMVHVSEDIADKAIQRLIDVEGNLNIERVVSLPFIADVQRLIRLAKVDFAKMDIKDVNVQLIQDTYKISQGKAGQVLEALEEWHFRIKESEIMILDADKHEKLTKIVDAKIESKKKNPKQKGQRIGSKTVATEEPMGAAEASAIVKANEYKEHAPKKYAETQKEKAARENKEKFDAMNEAVEPTPVQKSQKEIDDEIEIENQMNRLAAEEDAMSAIDKEFMNAPDDTPILEDGKLYNKDEYMAKQTAATREVNNIAACLMKGRGLKF